MYVKFPLQNTDAAKLSNSHMRKSIWSTVPSFEM